MKQMKWILGVTNAKQVKQLIEHNKLPHLEINPKVYNFPRVGVVNWMIEQGLFRTVEEAEEHIQNALRVNRTKETKRKNKKKEASKK